MIRDKPPPLVAPASDDGRRWVESEQWEGEVAYCTFYEPYEGDVALADKRGRFLIHECRHRSPFGERNRNWCMRCPAGFMFSSQHVYDSDLLRDRKMFVV